MLRHGKKEVDIMCMYLTNGNFLGQRLIGYDFYDSKTRGFVGMTEKQVITKLKNKEKVYGFVLGEEDGKEVLVLDKENFNMSNLQLKTGVNCQRRFKNVRKRRLYFVVFRRSHVTFSSVSLLKKCVYDLLLLTHEFLAFFQPV